MSKRKIHTKKKTNKKNKDSSSSLLAIVPIFMIILFVPIAVRALNVETYLADYIWYSKATTTMDIFLKIKSILFLLFCILMTVYIGYQLFVTYQKDKRNKSYQPHNSNQFNYTLAGASKLFIDEKCFIPLGLYMFLIVVSTIASKHSQIALRGMVEQFETMWVLLGYGLIVFYTYLFLSTIKQLQVIVNTVIVMITIVVSIGFTQFIGHDFFQTSFGKSLISKEELSFRFEEGHVYTTLYNPNYVGLFVALLVPFLLIVIYSVKGYTKKILSCLLTIGLLCCAYGSKSSSGIIGIIASLLALVLLLAILHRSYIIKHAKKIILGIVMCILVFVVVDISLNNPVGQYVADTYRMITDSSAKPESSLSSIITRDDEVELVYKEEPLKIQFSTENEQYVFTFRDSTGEELKQQLSQDNRIITLTDERFQDFQFSITQYDTIICFSVNVEGSVWYFTNQTDGTYYYCNNYGKLLKIDQKQEFKAFWNIGSGRGYIWDKTVPILKAHPILGTGPDTYALYFPNTDYLNLYHTGFSNEIITKPHSLYLQIAAQTGIPSLIAFLVFYAMYAVSSIRLYMRHNSKKYEVRIGLAILSGTFGYLVTSIANDSTIAVAPLFWTLIGVGLANNRMIKKNA